MSTGVLTPSPELDEHWWENEEDPATEVVGQSSDPVLKRQISRRRVVVMLENALDQAGLEWDERRAIDNILTSGSFVTAIKRLPQEEAHELIERWESETARMGSIEASKRSDAYLQLLSMSQDAVIKASLERLERGASPHMLGLLEELAGAAPAVEQTTVADASKAWLDWGHRQGLLYGAQH